MSSDQPPSPGPKDSSREVFDLAPEVEVPKTKAPPLPPAPPPSEVEVVESEQEDAERDPGTAPEGEPLVSDSLVSWKRWAVVGGVLTVAGAWSAFRSEPRFSLLHALMVLYYAPLLTLLGVGAGFAMAMLEGRRLGAWRELAARMFTSVAAGLAIGSVDWYLVGRPGGAVAGAAGYFGLLTLLMGWKAPRTARLASAHFVLAVLIYIPVMVARWMTEK